MGSWMHVSLKPLGCCFQVLFLVWVIVSFQRDLQILVVLEVEFQFRTLLFPWLRIPRAYPDPRENLKSRSPNLGPQLLKGTL